METCDKSAQDKETNKCSAHGGCLRCNGPGCDKSALDKETNKCIAHGGGPQCDKKKMSREEKWVKSRERYWERTECNQSTVYFGVPEWEEYPSESDSGQSQDSDHNMENRILQPYLASKWWAEHGYKHNHVEDKRLATDLCMLCDKKSKLLLSCESCQSKLCEDCMKIIEECDNYDGGYNHKHKKCACCAGEVLSANDIDNVKRLHDQKLCVECLYDAQHKPYRNSHNNELEPEMKNIRKELNKKLPKLLKSNYWIIKYQKSNDER